MRNQDSRRAGATSQEAEAEDEESRPLGWWGQTIKSQKTEDGDWGAALPGSEEMDMTEAGGGKLSGG